jgi:hypothetical protein
MADDSTDSGTNSQSDSQQQTGQQAPETGVDHDDDRRGGDNALKADLAKERRTRQRLERELEQTRTASLSDQERAVAEAKAAGRSEASAENGKRLARAEIRAAAAASGLKVTADDLDDLDMSKYIGDDGEPDEKAIEKRIKRWQALAPESTRPRGDIDQGTRGSTAPPSMNDVIRLAAGRG